MNNNLNNAGRHININDDFNNNYSPNRIQYERIPNEMHLLANNNPINYMNSNFTSNRLSEIENTVMGNFKNSYFNQVYDMQTFQSKLIYIYL